MMKKNIGFMLLTVGLVCMIVILTTKTVQSQNNGDSKQIEAYFQVLEKEYVLQMRNYLDEEGFRNSGVMLTRMVNPDGSREYTVTVHHGRLGNIPEEKMQELLLGLSEKAFEEENCSFIFCLKGNA